MSKGLEITGYKKNCMGTMSFDIKFSKMRKSDNFIVYPLDKETNKIFFQSNKRWAELDLNTKKFEISSSRPQYANRMHFQMSKMQGKNFVDICTDEQFDLIITNIRKTAGQKVGTNGVCYCDNSKASVI